MEKLACLLIRELLEKLKRCQIVVFLKYFDDLQNILFVTQVTK